jgi:hypothetical protein
LKICSPLAASWADALDTVTAVARHARINECLVTTLLSLTAHLHGLDLRNVKIDGQPKISNVIVGFRDCKPSA